MSCIMLVLPNEDTIAGFADDLMVLRYKHPEDLGIYAIKTVRAVQRPG